MITKTVYLLVYSLFGAVEHNALVEIKKSVHPYSVSDSVLLTKILSSVDEATSDKHLYYATLRLLQSICICMSETLKAKEDSLVAEANNLKTIDFTSEKDLEIYKKFYNKTCVNLRQEITNKLLYFNNIFEDDKYVFHNTSCGQSIQAEVDKKERQKQKAKEHAHLMKVVYDATVKTREKHKYNFRKYNLYSRVVPNLIKQPQHSTVFIITLDTENDGPDLEQKINTALSTNTVIDIDIIETNTDNKPKNNQDTITADCALQSIYMYLAESHEKNVTKVSKIIPGNDTIKIYVEVITNNKDQDYSTVCCKNGTIPKICLKKLMRQHEGLSDVNKTQITRVNSDESYRDTLTRIQTLLNANNKTSRINYTEKQIKKNYKSKLNVQNKLSISNFSQGSDFSNKLYFTTNVPFYRAIEKHNDAVTLTLNVVDTISLRPTSPTSLLMQEVLKNITYTSSPPFIGEITVKNETNATDNKINSVSWSQSLNFTSYNASTDSNQSAQVKSVTNIINSLKQITDMPISSTYSQDTEIKTNGKFKRNSNENHDSQANEVELRSPLLSSYLPLLSQTSTKGMLINDEVIATIHSSTKKNIELSHEAIIESDNDIENPVTTRNTESTLENMLTTSGSEDRNFTENKITRKNNTEQLANESELLTTQQNNVTEKLMEKLPSDGIQSNSINDMINNNNNLIPHRKGLSDQTNRYSQMIISGREEDNLVSLNKQKLSSAKFDNNSYIDNEIPNIGSDKTVLSTMKTNSNYEDLNKKVVEGYWTTKTLISESEQINTPNYSSTMPSNDAIDTLTSKLDYEFTYQTSAMPFDYTGDNGGTTIEPTTEVIDTIDSPNLHQIIIASNVRQLNASVIPEQSKLRYATANSSNKVDLSHLEITKSPYYGYDQEIMQASNGKQDTKEFVFSTEMMPHSAYTIPSFNSVVKGTYNYDDDDVNPSLIAVKSKEVNLKKNIIPSINTMDDNTKRSILIPKEEPLKPKTPFDHNVTTLSAIRSTSSVQKTDQTTQEDANFLFRNERKNDMERYTVYAEQIQQHAKESKFKSFNRVIKSFHEISGKIPITELINSKTIGITDPTNSLKISLLSQKDFVDNGKLIKKHNNITKYSTDQENNYIAKHRIMDMLETKLTNYTGTRGNYTQSQNFKIGGDRRDTMYETYDMDYTTMGSMSEKHKKDFTYTTTESSTKDSVIGQELKTHAKNEPILVKSLERRSEITDSHFTAAGKQRTPFEMTHGQVPTEIMTKFAKQSGETYLNKTLIYSDNTITITEKSVTPNIVEGYHETVDFDTNISTTVGQILGPNDILMTTKKMEQKEKHSLSFIYSEPKHNNISIDKLHKEPSLTYLNQTLHITTLDLSFGNKTSNVTMITSEADVNRKLRHLANVTKTWPKTSQKTSKASFEEGTGYVEQKFNPHVLEPTNIDNNVNTYIVKNTTQNLASNKEKELNSEYTHFGNNIMAMSDEVKESTNTSRKMNETRSQLSPLSNKMFNTTPLIAIQAKKFSNEEPMKNKYALYFLRSTSKKNIQTKYFTKSSKQSDQIDDSNTKHSILKLSDKLKDTDTSTTSIFIEPQNEQYNARVTHRTTETNPTVTTSETSFAFIPTEIDLLKKKFSQTTTEKTQVSEISIMLLNEEPTSKEDEDITNESIISKMVQINSTSLQSGDQITQKVFTDFNVQPYETYPSATAIPHIKSTIETNMTSKDEFLETTVIPTVGNVIEHSVLSTAEYKKNVIKPELEDQDLIDKDGTIKKEIDLPAQTVSVMGPILPTDYNSAIETFFQVAKDTKNYYKSIPLAQSSTGVDIPQPRETKAYEGTTREREIEIKEAVNSSSINYLHNKNDLSQNLKFINLNVNLSLKPDNQIGLPNYTITKYSSENHTHSILPLKSATVTDRDSDKKGDMDAQRTSDVGKRSTLQRSEISTEFSVDLRSPKNKSVVYVVSVQQNNASSCGNETWNSALEQKTSQMTLQQTKNISIFQDIKKLQVDTSQTAIELPNKVSDILTIVAPASESPEPEFVRVTREPIPDRHLIKHKNVTGETNFINEKSGTGVFLNQKTDKDNKKMSGVTLNFTIYFNGTTPHFIRNTIFNENTFLKTKYEDTSNSLIVTTERYDIKTSNHNVVFNRKLTTDDVTIDFIEFSKSTIHSNYTLDIIENRSPRNLLPNNSSRINSNPNDKRNKIQTKSIFKSQYTTIKPVDELRTQLEMSVTPLEMKTIILSPLQRNVPKNISDNVDIVDNATEKIQTSVVSTEKPSVTEIPVIISKVTRNEDGKLYSMQTNNVVMSALQKITESQIKTPTSEFTSSVVFSDEVYFTNQLQSDEENQQISIDAQALENSSKDVDGEDYNVTIIYNSPEAIQKDVTKKLLTKIAKTATTYETKDTLATTQLINTESTTPMGSKISEETTTIQLNNDLHQLVATSLNESLKNMSDIILSATNASIKLIFSTEKFEDTRSNANHLKEDKEFSHYDNTTEDTSTPRNLTQTSEVNQKNYIKKMSETTWHNTIGETSTSKQEKLKMPSAQPYGTVWPRGTKKIPVKRIIYNKYTDDTEEDIAINTPMPFGLFVQEANKKIIKKAQKLEKDSCKVLKNATEYMSKTLAELKSLIGDCRKKTNKTQVVGSIAKNYTQTRRTEYIKSVNTSKNLNKDKKTLLLPGKLELNNKNIALPTHLRPQEKNIRLQTKLPVLEIKVPMKVVLYRSKKKPSTMKPRKLTTKAVKFTVKPNGDLKTRRTKNPRPKDYKGPIKLIKTDMTKPRDIEIKPHGPFQVLPFLNKTNLFPIKTNTDQVKLQKKIINNNLQQLANTHNENIAQDGHLWFSRRQFTDGRSDYVPNFRVKNRLNFYNPPVVKPVPKPNRPFDPDYVTPRTYKPRVRSKPLVKTSSEVFKENLNKRQKAIVTWKQSRNDWHVQPEKYAYTLRKPADSRIVQDFVEVIKTPITQPSISKSKKGRTDSVRRYLLKAKFPRATTKKNYFLYPPDQDDASRNEDVISFYRQNFWLTEMTSASPAVTRQMLRPTRLNAKLNQKTIFFYSPTESDKHYF